MLKLPPVLNHAAASRFALTMGKDVSAQGDEVVIDAAALEQFDSSALAVLLECRRQAFAAGKQFSVWAAPTRLLQLADVYGVKALLPAASASPSR